MSGVPEGCSKAFDAFLYAAIGRNEDAMPLSVVSALARLEVDPWQEAEELARLPAEAAARRLSARLAELPDDTLCTLGAVGAARLVALLPGPAARRRRIERPVPPSDDPRQSPATIALIVTTGYLLSMVWLAANHQPRLAPPNRPDPAPVVADATTPSPGRH